MKILSKKDISKIVWQMIAHHFSDDDEDVTTEDTWLNGYENFDYFLEDFEETFGINPKDAHEKTVAEIIAFLYEKRKEIQLGENVDKKLNWRSYEEDFYDDDEEDE